MNLDELFESGWLRKGYPSKERMLNSLKQSEKYLDEARRNFDYRIDHSAILTAYSSMFHSARAILFKDGIVERSHAAMIEYLRIKHRKLGIELANALDKYRKLRHAVAYGLDTTIDEHDIASAINFANEFLIKVKKYLEV